MMLATAAVQSQCLTSVAQEELAALAETLEAVATVLTVVITLSTTDRLEIQPTTAHAEVSAETVAMPGLAAAEELVAMPVMPETRKSNSA